MSDDADMQAALIRELRRKVVRRDEHVLALQAELMQVRADLAAFHEECDKVGIPYDAEGLVRHHRGNAGAAGAAAAMAKDAAEITRLRADLTERDQRIAAALAVIDDPNQLLNIRARVRRALSPGRAADTEGEAGE